MKTIIIQGSARSDGNTSKIVRVISGHFNADIIDLNTKIINPYHYEHIHMDDDFLPIIKKVVNYDLIVFATPVYWYSMSGLMKNFFDRISDCLKIEKETGRLLRGKKVIAVSCGSDSNETEGFFVPFKESAHYLGMEYLGDLHTWIEADIPSNLVLNEIEDFLVNLNLNSNTYTI